MKLNIKLFSLCVFGLALMTSCVKFKPENPPVPGAVELDPETTVVFSVEQLKGMFPGDFDSVTRYQRSDSSWVDIYIYVEVIGNDISGNIYKSMYVRDVSDPGKMGQALNIAVDKTGLYNFFPIGQKLYIKVTDLYVGRYKNLPQLGYRYKDDNGRVELGRIPDVVFMNHVIKSGLPPSELADMPKPIEITEAAQLEDPSLYNQLVVLRGVQFAGDVVGKEFAPAPPVGVNPTSTNRYFTINGEGSELALRTSSACRFFNRTIPGGTGDMVCIYAVYDESKQFYLRQYSDLDMTKFEATDHIDVPIFYASFSDGLNGFKAVSVKGNETWTWGKYGGGCAMFQGDKSYKVNEDWLISGDMVEIPVSTEDGVFDTVELSFDQALSYKYDQPYSNYSVRISENYDPAVHKDPKEADWQILEIPNPHPGNSFDFQSSGAIDLKHMIGKKFYVAFVYKSTSEGMATWEVNKLKIIGNYKR